MTVQPSAGGVPSTPVGDETGQTIWREGDRIRRTDGTGYSDPVPDDQIRAHIAARAYSDPLFIRFAEAVLAIRAFERAQHGVLISGDTVTGCVCGDVMCSKHLLLAWCDELAASYEAKVYDLAAETARSDDLAAQLRDARAENERLRTLAERHARNLAGFGPDASGYTVAEVEAVEVELAAERAKVERATDVDLIRRAIADPGQFLPRGANYTEGLHAWQARAVRAALTGGDR